MADNWPSIAALLADGGRGGADPRPAVLSSVLHIINSGANYLAPPGGRWGLISNVKLMTGWEPGSRPLIPNMQTTGGPHGLVSTAES
jgi:hypothetical protein